MISISFQIGSPLSSPVWIGVPAFVRVRRQDSPTARLKIFEIHGLSAGTLGIRYRGFGMQMKHAPLDDLEALRATLGIATGSR
jgi:hypothetical protein